MKIGTKQEIKLGDDILDSQEIKVWIEKLKEKVEIEDGRSEDFWMDTGQENHVPSKTEEELESWENLDRKGKSQVKDWEYGVTLILSAYFPIHAQDLAEDIEAIPNNDFNAWPTSHIDWETATAELKKDYVKINATDRLGYTFLYFAR